MRRVLGLAVGLLLAVGGSQAEAATTFGSNLSGSSIGSGSTSSDSTYAMSGIAAAGVASGGAVAPSDGVVVRWRVRVVATQSAGVTAALRVIRGNVGHGTGATESIPTAPGTYTFPTQLPVKAGDVIGLNTSAGLRFFASGATGDVREDWSPALPDGGAGTAPSTSNSSRVELNADVEPDVDGDGYGDETQDQCPGDAAVQTLPCDRTPPETTITKQPKAKRTAKQARLEFTSSETDSAFECSFDGSAFAVCSSPTLKTLSVGPHVFEVRAIDAAGNVDQSPASAEWKVVKKKHKKHHQHHHHVHA